MYRAGKAVLERELAVMVQHGSLDLRLVDLGSWGDGGCDSTDMMFIQRVIVERQQSTQGVQKHNYNWIFEKELPCRIQQKFPFEITHLVQ